MRATVRPDHHGQVSEQVDNPRQAFLVECYVSAPSEADLQTLAARATAACAWMTSSGTTVEYLGALLVAADEVEFHLFVAPDIDAVMAASHRAELRVERVVEALAVSGRPSPNTQPISIGGEVEGAVGDLSRQLGT